MSWEEKSKQIVNKLKHGEQLSEEEIDLIISEEVDGLDNYIEEENGDTRWYRLMSTFCKTDDDRWFCLPWKAGLTEHQENEFWEQPYEVKREIKEIVTKVNVWTPVKVGKRL